MTANQTSLPPSKVPGISNASYPQTKTLCVSLMGMSNSDLKLSAPTELTERYIKSKLVKHRLVERKGELELWCSTEDKRHQGLSEFDRWHLLCGGDGIAFFMREKTARMNFEYLANELGEI